MVCAGNITRTARARAHASRCVLHGRYDVGMLSHAQIIVGAPDGYLLGFAISRRSGLSSRPPDGAWECASDPLQIREDAIAPLRVELVNRFLKKPLIVHARLRLVSELRLGGQ